MPSGIRSWDDGSSWDSGLQWDLGDAPSLGDVQPYLNLITSQHKDKPNFISVLTALLQPVADNITTLQSIPNLFDLDLADGDQLDIIGQWVGKTRFLNIPLSGVYFSFDTGGIGFDQGTWLGPFDPLTGLVSLPDESYRTYLRAAIAANHWDGAIPSAYSILNPIFFPTGSVAVIFDNGDMTMWFGLDGESPDAVTAALLTEGYLDLRPSGVKILGYIVSSVIGTPMFGFDAETRALSGFDVGSWAVELGSPRSRIPTLFLDGTFNLDGTQSLNGIRHF